MSWSGQTCAEADAGAAAGGAVSAAAPALAAAGRRALAVSFPALPQDLTGRLSIVCHSAEPSAGAFLSIQLTCVTESCLSAELTSLSQSAQLKTACKVKALLLLTFCSTRILSSTKGSSTYVSSSE